jgi:hypothetical protein
VTLLADGGVPQAVGMVALLAGIAVAGAVVVAEVTRA